MWQLDRIDDENGIAYMIFRPPDYLVDSRLVPFVNVTISSGSHRLPQTSWFDEPFVPHSLRLDLAVRFWFWFWFWSWSWSCLRLCLSRVVRFQNEAFGISSFYSYHEWFRSPIKPSNQEYGKRLSCHLAETQRMNITTINHVTIPYSNPNDYMNCLGIIFLASIPMILLTIGQWKMQIRTIQYWCDKYNLTSQWWLCCSLVTIRFLRDFWIPFYQSMERVHISLRISAWW